MNDDERKFESYLRSFQPVQPPALPQAARGAMGPAAQRPQRSPQF
jgi:hypothetical protein